jgi:hypothetical protein
VTRPGSRLDALLRFPPWAGAGLLRPGYRSSAERPTALFTIDFSLGATLYVVAALVLVFGFWLYHDRRDKQFFEGERRKAIFHCIRCDKLYTSREGAELCSCPRCGNENSRLQF